VIQLTTMQTYNKKNKKELIAEIEKLNKELSILVNYPKSTTAYFIRMEIHYQHDVLGLMWGIDPNKLVDTDKANGK
jgi:hypothetical protein